MYIGVCLTRVCILVFFLPEYVYWCLSYPSMYIYTYSGKTNTNIHTRVRQTPIYILGYDKHQYTYSGKTNTNIHTRVRYVYCCLSYPSMYISACLTRVCILVFVLPEYVYWCLSYPSMYISACLTRVCILVFKQQYTYSGKTSTNIHTRVRQAPIYILG
jgi:hypothetical protein